MILFESPKQYEIGYQIIVGSVLKVRWGWFRWCFSESKAQNALRAVNSVDTNWNWTFHATYFLRSFSLVTTSKPQMYYIPVYDINMMMTSWNGNIFRVTGLFVRGINRWPVDSPHKGQWRRSIDPYISTFKGKKIQIISLGFRGVLRIRWVMIGTHYPHHWPLNVRGTIVYWLKSFLLFQPG